jgi:hypothetical protein
MQMSLNTHHSHFDFLPTNLRALSDVRGERFHQEISAAAKATTGNGI